ncbi:MAG: hypothetical protein ACKON9_03225, partial [Planctomycetaceae bacterium]
MTAAAHRQGCCSAEDAGDARRVADRLGIPFHSLNFQHEFKRIKDYFADEYLAGRTPNPCVQCNNWLKFGKLWEFAQQVEARYIATGHYARIVHAAPVSGEPHRLFRALDDTKDQSYVLWQIIAAIIGWVVFSLVAYVVGRGFLKGPDTRITIGQALRMVGFAQTPKLLGALGFIPLFGWIFGL